MFPPLFREEYFVTAPTLENLRISILAPSVAFPHVLEFLPIKVHFGAPAVCEVKAVLQQRTGKSQQHYVYPAVGLLRRI